VKLLITLFCENNLFYSIESYNNDMTFGYALFPKDHGAGHFY